METPINPADPDPDLCYGSCTFEDEDDRWDESDGPEVDDGDDDEDDSDEEDDD
jgi:hypothetical protein